VPCSAISNTLTYIVNPNPAVENTTQRCQRGRLPARWRDSSDPT
jgi:hypothetical protein